MSVPSKAPITELHRHLGGQFVRGGAARFCVWSPTSSQVNVVIVNLDGQVQQTHVMTPVDGYHYLEQSGLGVGARYFYQFDGGPLRPDPASRFQPDGVHGPSMVCSGDESESAFSWTDQSWSGMQRSDLVIYEMHVGTFTDEGTYDSAIARLDELVELGVTAIELLPLADAAGKWNWGYDGVCLFAPNRNYGHPDRLKSFVDAAHSRGLAVILDVVYNHLGPEGNYLGESGPYLSSRHHTVWGSAPNFDDPQYGEQARRFFIANAIYWLDEFHFDGLRVDAIHCMLDDQKPHVVVEMAQAVRDWSVESGRLAILIAESNVYDPGMTQPIHADGCGFDAQWGDCFLHSMFAVVRPGEQLCQRIYQPGDDLDQVLRMGYVYSGTIREPRKRHDLGERVDTMPLVYSIQNHDFIGNHPLGKRLHQLTSLETQRAAAALLILSPAIPMLFMGEEFACEKPFQFFVDFGDEHLRQAVVEGRRREYPQHQWNDGNSPIDPAAFFDSKIGPASNGNASMRAWYQDLIQMRKQLISDGLLSSVNVRIETDLDEGLFRLRYESSSRWAEVIVRLNEKSQMKEPLTIPASGQIVLDSLNSDSERLEPNHARVVTS
ncbi:Malto-oligosyltrehalose trehalohydrolase [Rubripirellula amarantea]|uniref:Malto-oligosyltrehalose trehalohydrolase n=1 Tax=Rubripirellula amarantea TaxID=2527999 RepID=A0A5C5WUE9_9BACT|nr:malto-oligosyltrehalose trehalohydrolase [Rubripirellula amarantea]TWT54170.1 Malto-oligosyltrehalose trehalohydrolase [Rubripirellula amarantea]